MLWDGPSLTMVTWRGEMEGIIVSSTLKNRGVDTTVPVEVVVAGFLGGKGQEYWVGHGAATAVPRGQRDGGIVSSTLENGGVEMLDACEVDIGRGWEVF